MNQLFLETSYNNIYMITLKDFEVVASRKVLNITKMSDIINSELEILLMESNLTLKEIDEIFLTKGPGSFTGVRVAITLAKTLMIINKSLKVYSISSLLFQAGISKSISSIDAKGGKKYVGIYDNGNMVIPDQILDDLTFEEFKSQFSLFELKEDMKDLNFVDNFLALKDKFLKVDNVHDFEPIYIKKFI